MKKRKLLFEHALSGTKYTYGVNEYIQSFFDAQEEEMKNYFETKEELTLDFIIEYYRKSCRWNLKIIEE